MSNMYTIISQIYIYFAKEYVLKFHISRIFAICILLYIFTYNKSLDSDIKYQIGHFLLPDTFQYCNKDLNQPLLKYQQYQIEKNTLFCFKNQIAFNYSKKYMIFFAYLMSGSVLLALFPEVTLLLQILSNPDRFRMFSISAFRASSILKN